MHEHLPRLFDWLCLTWLWCVGPAAPHDPPAVVAEPELICDVENVEDMVALPDSDWIIGSGLGDAAFQSGALHLIDARANTAKRVALDLSPDQAPEPPYDACPAPPDATLFSAHGLSVRAEAAGRAQLFVVNHGGRESIEVFHVTRTASEPAFRWIGCIVAPELAHSINAVAVGMSGRLVLSATAANGRGTPEQLFAGENTGAVYTWDSASGWAELEGSALPGNNGIELSDDERGVFVAAWADASVVYLPLAPEAGARRTIELDFYPDNIRRSYDGKLVVTGQVATLEEVSACVQANDPRCGIDYRSALIDPATFEANTLLDGEATAEFGLATVTLKTAHALWMGSARSQCIGKVQLD